jgi:hypothetical protein
MSASGWVHVSVDEIVRETERALLVLIDSEEVWLPKSAVADGESYVPGDRNVTLSIRDWLAREKGLEGE